MSESRVSIASDYAVLEAGPYYFYFGYEYDKDGDDEIWGFVARKNKEIVFGYPVSGEVRFDVTEQLLKGIGKFIALEQLRSEK
jgi:hypothetical protein